MDFSSANVPISRETWAPRSPPASRPDPYASDAYPERAPPPAPRSDVDTKSSGRDDGRGDGEGFRRDREFAPRRPAQAPSAQPNNVLGVFGLSIRTRERDLEDEFLRYGDVDKVVIVYDQRTDRSRGFGFITMRTIEDATRCIDKLNGLSLHGRNIRVDYSATQRPHAPTPGEYKGVQKPIEDDRFGGRGGRYDDRRGGYDDRRGGYDDRRGGGRDRYDDRQRDRDYGSSRRDHDDPYAGRSRRDDYDRGDSRRRSPSPRRSRYSGSPDHRPAPRDYDAPVPAPAAEVPRY